MPGFIHQGDNDPKTLRTTKCKLFKEKQGAWVSNGDRLASSEVLTLFP